MTAYLIIGVIIAAIVGYILLKLTSNKPRVLTERETQQWSYAEQRADTEKDAAETKARTEEQGIRDAHTREIQAIRVEKGKWDNSKAKDPLQEALDRYDTVHGRNDKIQLLWFLPWLWLLQACALAHGGAGAGSVEMITIPKAQYERAVRAINQCTADRLKYQADLKQAVALCENSCERRVAQCRADLKAVREQRAILQRKPVSDGIGWKVATVVLAGTTAVGIAVVLVAVFSPTTLRITTP